MTFLSPLDTCAPGMSAQRVRMGIAAENIAHINTTRTKAGGPCRRKNVLFENFGTGSFREVVRNAAVGSRFTSRHAGVGVSGIIEDDREMKRVYNPGRPDADAEGYVNMLDVNLLKETVDGMSTTRSYKTSVTTLSIVKLMAQKALDIGK